MSEQVIYKDMANSNTVRHVLIRIMQISRSLWNVQHHSRVQGIGIGTNNLLVGIINLLPVFPISIEMLRNGPECITRLYRVGGGMPLYLWNIEYGPGLQAVRITPDRSFVGIVDLLPVCSVVICLLRNGPERIA